MLYIYEIDGVVIYWQFFVIICVEVDFVCFLFDEELVVV